MQPVERLSIEVTNRCDKACWFCYNGSRSEGITAWSVDELVALVADCARRGVKAVSFGGGEPLQYEGLFDVLAGLRGTIFRSITTNGLQLSSSVLNRLVEVAVDKVHVSVHVPGDRTEVDRVIGQVHALAARGLRSGVNLLVPGSSVEASIRAADCIRSAGIANERVVYLPMRGRDTPSPQQIAVVAGNLPFQSTSCLTQCGLSPGFCSIRHDKTVAWCSYTLARRPLRELTHRGLLTALEGLGVRHCGVIPAEDTKDLRTTRLFEHDDGSRLPT